MWLSPGLTPAKGGGTAWQGGTHSQLWPPAPPPAKSAPRPQPCSPAPFTDAPSPQTPPGVPSPLLLWGQALSTAPFPPPPPLAAASTHGCSRAGGLLAPQVLLGTGWPGGRGDSQKHTCRQDRDRDMPRKRPTPRLQPGLGVGEGDTGRGRAAPWGQQGASRRMGTRCGERGAGDTQGCWGHPGAQASSSNRGVPRGMGVGAQGCRRHGSCLETRPDPGPRGALGESRGPKSLRGGFAWRAAAAWEAVGDAGGPRVPVAPAPAPRWGPDRCAPTRAHPHRRLRHSSKRGENTPPPFPPPPHLGASQGCSRAGGTPRRGAKPPLPGLVLASPRLQGATTALCDGTRHATRTRPTYPIGLGTACSQGKAGGWSACSTRKRTQRRLRQSLRYRSVCRGGEEDDGERGPGAAPPPPPPAVPQHLPPPLRGRGLGGGAPSWGRGWHLVLAGGCDRVARPPPALWPRLRPRLAHGLGTPLGTGRVDPSELENSAVPSEERLGGGTVPLLLLASPSSLRHP